LGPLLYIIYVNDLSSTISKAELIQFADDTSVFMHGDTHEVTYTHTKVLEELNNWFKSNGLFLNETKTNILVYTTNNRLQNKLNLNFKNQTNYVKFLGIHIDKNLTYKNHIDALLKKLNQCVFVMRVLSRVCNQETLLKVYYGLVYSRLVYGIIIWGNSVDAGKIFNIQKKIVRIMCGVDQRISCKPLFKKLNILTLPSIYINNIILFIINNSEYFSNFIPQHSYTTRNKMNILQYPIHRLSLTEKTPAYQGLKLYNHLPQNLKGQINNKSFPVKLKKFLLNSVFYSINEFLK
jgi:hypothetical protein